MKNKALALLVIFSLLTCSANLYAKERRGAELVITKTNGQLIQGELIAVRQDSLLLLSYEGADVSVEMKDLKVLRIVHRSNLGKGAIRGLAGGAIVGAVIGIADSGSVGSHEVFKYIFFCAVVMAVPGLLIGAGAEILSSKDETIHFEEKSPKEAKKIFEDLRHLARITNAQ